MISGYVEENNERVNEKRIIINDAGDGTEYGIDRNWKGEEGDVKKGGESMQHSMQYN